jgi:hypothetical protein
MLDAQSRAAGDSENEYELPASAKAERHAFNNERWCALGRQLADAEINRKVPHAIVQEMVLMRRMELTGHP